MPWWCWIWDYNASPGRRTSDPLPSKKCAQRPDANGLPCLQAPQDLTWLRAFPSLPAALPHSSYSKLEMNGAMMTAA
eukprot:1157677-Pelagomonas_calceolata.AAC.5